MKNNSNTRNRFRHCDSSVAAGARDPTPALLRPTTTHGVSEMKSKDLIPIDQLAASWREEAASLAFWPQNEQAVKALELAADQLDQALAAYGEDILTLAQAARVSGYSHDHLARMLRESPELNAGRPGAPRIRRRDLPVRGDRQRRKNHRPASQGMPELLRDILSSKFNDGGQ